MVLTMIGSVILLVVLIFLNAVFASAEIAVISMSDAKLSKMTSDGDKRAIRLTALVSEPSRFLATIQVAITLAGLLSSAFAADKFAKPIVEAIMKTNISVSESLVSNITVIVITVVLAYFNLVFGELVPKRIAMKKADQMALGMSGLLYGVSKVFKPIVFILTASTNLLLRIFGIDPNETDDRVSEEEIRMMLAQGIEQGTIKNSEKEMIQNVFEFDDTSVDQICTHRIDVDSIRLSDSVEKWQNTIEKCRHSFFPIYNENNEDIVGVLDTKDYFRLDDKSKESVMKNAVDKPFFIPEGMKANVLFNEMRKSRKYFAVVVDEYGGLSGIITLHDLLESLVGDMYEVEEKAKPQEIQKLGDNKWCIYGSADLADVAQALNKEMPSNTIDTFNGYVCSLLEQIPSDGESFVCETENLKIEVHNVKNHMIEKTTVYVK
ncbi:MAG: hemolysin family protein [Clostridiales bacterium]|nr:hemolysin family protein [Clostridiales bacterium]